MCLFGRSRLVFGKSHHISGKFLVAFGPLEVGTRERIEPISDMRNTGVCVASSVPFPTLMTKAQHQSDAPRSPAQRPMQCLSSYAFAVAGAVESLLALRTAPNFAPETVQPYSASPLSVKQLLDCDPDNQGCHGGWSDYSWPYLTSNTLADNSNYVAGPGVCHAAAQPAGQGSISDFQYVPPGDEYALREVGGGQWFRNEHSVFHACVFGGAGGGGALTTQGRSALDANVLQQVVTAAAQPAIQSSDDGGVMHVRSPAGCFAV